MEHQQNLILEQNDHSPEKWFVPDNFKRIGSRLFYISTKVNVDWFSAKAACRKMGGQLATIRNNKELNLIERKLKHDVGYWLDLNDLDKEGEFVTSSGKPASFLNWRKRQPDNHNNNEHCVQLINDYFYDSPCSTKHRFICEA
ncbi:hypothetical protein KR200_011495 [Drosophila serrata]|nr:hypothetical protein KR200_011495 [Drosophila serrata]